jgi:hypothetical protein
MLTEPVTDSALWSDAMETGNAAAIVFCPTVGIRPVFVAVVVACVAAVVVCVAIVPKLVLPVVCSALVAAPAGSGKAAAVIATEFIGLTATTKGLSVASAAADAGLTVAVFVPSVNLVVCEPPVRTASVAAPDGSGSEEALMGIVLWLLAMTTGELAAIRA